MQIEHANGQQSLTSDAQALRVLSILVGALFAGQAIFAGVVTFIQMQGGMGEQDTSMEIVLGIATAGVMTVMLVLQGLLPGLRDKLNIQPSGSADETLSEEQQQAMRIRAKFVTITVMRAAMVEGSGLLATVSYLITGQLLFLAGTCVSLGVLMYLFPTRSRLDAFARQSA